MLRPSAEFSWPNSRLQRSPPTLHFTVHLNDRRTSYVSANARMRNAEFGCLVRSALMERYAVVGIYFRRRSVDSALFYPSCEKRHIVDCQST